MATSPSRSSFKTTIVFGETTIPVALYTGAEETRPKSAEFTGKKAPAKAGDRSKNKVTGRSVPSSAVYLTAPATDGTLVQFSAAERKAAQFVEGPYAVESIVNPRTVGTTYFPTKVYQLRANTDSKVGGESNARKLALFLQALDGDLALVQLPLAPKAAPVVALISDQGYLLVCHFSNAVREPLPLPAYENDFFPGELNEAFALADELRKVTVDTADQAAVRVQAAIDAKAAEGVDVVAPRKAVEVTA